MHPSSPTGGQRDRLHASLDQVPPDRGWCALVVGDHYAGSVTQAQRQTREWARAHGLTCRTATREDGDGRTVLFVAFASHREDLPARARHTPGRRMVERYPPVERPASICASLRRAVSLPTGLHRAPRRRGAGRPACRRTARSTRAGPSSGDDGPAPPPDGPHDVAAPATGGAA